MRDRRIGTGKVGCEEMTTRVMRRSSSRVRFLCHKLCDGARTRRLIMNSIGQRKFLEMCRRFVRILVIKERIDI